MIGFFDCVHCFYVEFCFFFFKQKTAYEMRISDWSSDVCSSDLQFGVRHDGGPGTDQDLCATRPLAWHREGASTVCAGGPDVSAAGARGRPLHVAGRAKPYQRSSAVTATRRALGPLRHAPSWQPPALCLHLASGRSEERRVG